MTENHDTFLQRIGPYFAPSQLNRIELAYIVAKDKHRGQNRKETDEHGQPVRYFEHVRRATLIGLDKARIIRVDTVCAAFLHDTLEDTRLTPEQIEDWFGTDVCAIVKTLSKVPKEGYLDRLLACSDWRAYFVKACDRFDNLQTMANTSDDFKRKQCQETENHYFRLFDRMVNLAPTEYRDGCSRLFDAVQEQVRVVRWELVQKEAEEHHRQRRAEQAARNGEITSPREGTPSSSTSGS